MSLVAAAGAIALTAAAGGRHPAPPDVPGAAHRAVQADTACPVYPRLEYALRDARPRGPALRAVSAAFDRGIVAWLGGDRARVQRVQDSLATALERGDRRRRAAHCDEAARRLAAGRAATRQLGDGDGAVAYRVVAPLTRGRHRPRPVLVALHGAGGDEQTWLEGYGAGRLQQLAQSHGLVVVTPVTTALLRDPTAFTRLLDTVATRHPIDRRRVFVVGHSLGALATWALLQELPPGTVAAAACIAGPCGGPPDRRVSGAREVPVRTDGERPPLLVVTGGADLVVPAAAIDSATRAAIDAGWRVDRRHFPDHGHTMVVGGSLDAVLRWLLAP